MPNERNEKGRFVKGMIPWNKKEYLKKTCPKCNKVFWVKPSLDRINYCSRRCVRLGVTTSENQKRIARKLFMGNKWRLGKSPWTRVW